MQGIIRKNKTILGKLDSLHQGWLALVEPSATNINGDIAAYFSTSILSLFAKIRLKGITASSLPDIPPDASEIERLTIVKSYEWENPRVHLQFGMKGENDTEWTPIWEAAMLNQTGVPFYTLNCMNVLGSSGDFIVGDTVSLGVRALDVGWGGLTGNDHVTLYGGAIQEAWQLPPVINVANQISRERVSLVAGNDHVIEANPGRKGLVIAAWSNGVASISEGYPEYGLTGFPLMGQGSAYELNSTRLWRGSILIECVEDIEIEITEYY